MTWHVGVWRSGSQEDVAKIAIESIDQNVLRKDSGRFFSDLFSDVVSVLEAIASIYQRCESRHGFDN